MNKHTMTRTLMALPLTLALTACGGGSGSSDSSNTGSTTTSGTSTSTTSTTGSTTQAEGGLYVGYYMESPTSNPEDPTMGAIYLDIPDDNSAFNGSMSFTYLGCQSNSVGTLSGTRNNNEMNGSWTGTVDGTAQNGSFNLDYNQESGGFEGTYTVAGGKQEIDVSGCISYYIAAEGTAALFPVNSVNTAPALVCANQSVTVDFDNRTIEWVLCSSTYMDNTLVSIISSESAGQNLNDAIVWQTALDGDQDSLIIPASVLSELISGQEYIISVNTISSDTVLYSSSVTVTAP